MMDPRKEFIIDTVLDLLQPAAAASDGLGRSRSQLRQDLTNDPALDRFLNLPEVTALQACVHRVSAAAPVSRRCA